MVEVKSISDRSPKSNTNSSKSVHELRQEAVEGIGQIAGLGCIMVGWFSDAGAINMHWPDVASEAADMADANEGVAKAVDMLLQIGPWAGMVTALMPLVLQCLVNHRVLPADKLAGANVVKPEVLESQVKTAMAQQAIEAMRQQRQAEAELAAMREEFAEFAAASDDGNS